MKKAVARGLGAALLCIGLSGGAAADMGAPTPLGMAGWVMPTPIGMADWDAPMQPGMAERAAPMQPAMAERATPTQFGIAERATPMQPAIAERATPTQFGMAEWAPPMQLAMAEWAPPMQLGMAEQATPMQLAAEFGSLPVGARQLQDIRAGFSFGGIDVKIGFVLKTIFNDVVQVEQSFNLENVGDSIPDSVVNDFSENGKVSMTSTEFFKNGNLLITKAVNQKDNVDLQQINTAVIDVVVSGQLLDTVNSGMFRGATKDMSNAVKFSLYRAAGL